MRDAGILARRCRQIMMDRNVISSVMGPYLLKVSATFILVPMIHPWWGFNKKERERERARERDRRTAMKLRKPIQLPRVSESPWPLIQLFQPPSTAPRSNKGPAKRMVVSRTSQKMSRELTGHQPRIFNDWAIDRLPFCVMSIQTATVVTMQVIDTILTRVRITEGASLLSVRVGRVVEKR